MNKKLIWGSALLIAVGVLALGLGWFGGSSTGTQLSTAQQAALNRSYAPSLGAPGAKVTLVEFLDPACEACAQFYPLVKDLLAQSEGKLRLVVRYAPFHKGSTEAVLALEAARLQGKYWQALEALMRSQNEWTLNHQVQAERIWPVLERVGVDVAQARADAQSPKLQAQMEQDLIDGKDLEVFRTPSFFVNGYALTEFGYEQLKQLIAEQTSIAYGP